MTQLKTHGMMAGALRLRRLPLTVGTALAAIGLAACAPQQRVLVGSVPDGYEVNHPITLSEGLATMDVPVGPETPYLARGMDQNVLAFADAFIASHATEIAIVLPQGSPNAAAAVSIGRQLEQILLAAGVPQSNISYRAYPANTNETQAPVRLAYVRIAASTTPCGPWQDDLTPNHDNKNYEAFGCATQQNLAAMVSNPLDLLYPRTMTSADAARRATVLGNYEAGNDTATNYPTTTATSTTSGSGQ